MDFSGKLREISTRHYLPLLFVRDTDLRKGTMCLFCVPIHKKKKLYCNLNFDSVEAQNIPLYKALLKQKAIYFKQTFAVISFSIIPHFIILLIAILTNNLIFICNTFSFFFLSFYKVFVSTSF